MPIIKLGGLGRKPVVLQVASMGNSVRSITELVGNTNSLKDIGQRELIPMSLRTSSSQKGIKGCW